MSRSLLGIAVLLALLALSLLAGCGGDGAAPPANVGSVSGRVVAGLVNPVGFGNVMITIGGQSTRSDANGDFVVNNIPPGTYDVQINPDPDNTGHPFVVPPNDDDIEVRVFANQNTVLNEDIVLVDENDLPPGPPGG